jgi:hypothetical protein
MHFGMKSYLKNTRNHTAKHALKQTSRPTHQEKIIQTLHELCLRPIYRSHN